MIINEVHADTTAVARAARWSHLLPTWPPSSSTSSS